MPYYRQHPHLDNSTDYDSEELDPRDARFVETLRSDLTTKSLDYLVRHYPELTFGRAKVKEGVVKKRDHDFVERKDSVTTWADWRKGRDKT